MIILRDITYNGIITLDPLCLEKALFLSIVSWDTLEDMSFVAFILLLLSAASLALEHMHPEGKDKTIVMTEKHQQRRPEMVFAARTVENRGIARADSRNIQPS